MKKWTALLLTLGAAAWAVAAATPGRAPSRTDYFQSTDFTRPLRAVELQYFRVDPQRWDLMIRRMAQYHADAISTYVHWGWHEYEEGKFDFTGKTDPGRDLVRFLQLCARHHLKVILKPGPFIDAETNAGGIPQWLFANHPETIARNVKDKPFIHGDSDMPRISYLHPKYLELTRRYFIELGRATADLEWPHGPIVAVQLDNETPGDGFTTISNYLSYNFKADYNDYYLNVAWPRWLQERYGDLECLNRAYGADYASFPDVPMPRKWDHPLDQQQLQIYLDLDRFAEWQYVEALRRFRAMLREAGFSGPTYQDLLCMPWDLAGQIGDAGGMAEAAGGWIGSNVYSEVYRPWTVFVGNPAYKYNWDEYVHMSVWRTRLTGTLSEPYPSFVPEITCSQRFYFQAPVAWGADAVNIYVGWQTPHDREPIAPEGAWGMEACVTGTGEVRDCFWNGKNTYLFMEQAGAFGPGIERPRVAIGYSHEPEHAWNWEFRFNADRPHKKIRHPELEDLVRGTNIGDRGQLIARNFVQADYDFDVIHLDHLKPGQLERYQLVIVPTSPQNPAPAPDPLVERPGGYTLYLPPGHDVVNVARFEKLGVVFKQAWAEPEDVDVTQRLASDGTAVVAIVNRGRSEFNGRAWFREGADSVTARVGPKAIGFVSLHDGAIRAALIDHAGGAGEYLYRDDRIAFSGTFASVAVQPGWILASAPDGGTVTVQSGIFKGPVRLVRLSLGGRTKEEPFQWNDGVLTFDFDPGAGSDRTDLYAALAEGVSLEDALGEYLLRTRPDRASTGAAAD